MAPCAAVASEIAARKSVLRIIMDLPVPCSGASGADEETPPLPHEGRRSLAYSASDAGMAKRSAGMSLTLISAFSIVMAHSVIASIGDGPTPMQQAITIEKAGINVSDIPTDRFAMPAPEAE